MGQKLIIKNADFSTNGIRNDAVKLIDLLGITIGYQWGAYQASTGHPKRCPYIMSTANNKRAGVTGFVDIANYGFGTVTITAKAGCKFVAYFGNSTNGTAAGGAEDNILDWAYYADGESVTANISSCSKAVIMVAHTAEDTLTSADINDYVTIVES